MFLKNKQTKKTNLMDTEFVLKDISDLRHRVFIPIWVIINLEFMFIRDGNAVLISLTVNLWKPLMAPSYISNCHHDLFYFSKFLSAIVAFLFVFLILILHSEGKQTA